MELARIIVLTFLLVTVDCSQKTRLAQKVDALDNLFTGKMYLVNEKLETGRAERQKLEKKLNETMEYLETVGNVDAKAVQDRNSQAGQGEFDMLTEKVNKLTDIVDKNDRTTREMKESVSRIKRGVQQEKMARKTDTQAVIEQLMQMQDNQIKMQEKLNDMQENQIKMQENQVKMQENQVKMQENQVKMQENQVKMQENQTQMQENLLSKIVDIIATLSDLMNKVNTLETTMTAHKDEVLETNNIINTQLTETKSITQNLESSISAVTGQIQTIKENVAPKLYCNNEMDLDDCLQKHFTDQRQLIDFIMTIYQPVWLVGGRTKYEGRVEVNYQGRRGTICDDDWDDKDAKVICRMLGFSGGTALQGTSPSNSGSPKHSFGPGTGEILLENIKCSGSEQSIFDCGHHGIGVHNCDHYEDAGVRCDP